MSVDAVIVGGRVAGASTALLMARAGLRVLVVDRGARGSDTVSTHALMRGGVLQLSRWGLLDQVARTGAPPVRRVTFHYGSTELPVALRPQAGVDALYAPRRTVLDELLVEAAEEAGAEFRFRTSLVDLNRDHTGRVGGVVLRDHTGSTTVEPADLVVGADGRRSRVARLVDAPTMARGSHAAAYVYGYWPNLEFDGYHWYYGDGLSAGAIPTNDGTVCVFVAGAAAALDPALRRDRPVDVARRLAGHLDRRLAETLAGPPEGEVHCFGGLPAQLRHAYGPGWALVGDAGWWKDPLSTHGMSDALRDAELLTRAVTTGAASAGALEGAFAEYQAHRDRTARAMHPVVDRLASHQWDLDEVQRLLRALSTVMADEVESIRAFDGTRAPDACSRRVS
jgi:flavin-dependent dehydrogenase